MKSADTLTLGSNVLKAGVFLFPKNKACDNISQAENKNVTESILTVLSPGKIYSRQESTRSRPLKVRANM